MQFVTGRSPDSWRYGFFFSSGTGFPRSSNYSAHRGEGMEVGDTGV